MASAFDGFMADFFADLDILPDADAVREGVYGLTVDAVDVYFTLDTDGDSVLMFSRLGEVASGVGEELRRELLSANFLFGRTSGGTLAVAESGEVVLQRLLDFSGVVDDMAFFGEQAARFMEAAAEWRRLLTEFGGGGGEGGDGFVRV